MQWTKLPYKQLFDNKYPLNYKSKSRYKTKLYLFTIASIYNKIWTSFLYNSCVLFADSTYSSKPALHADSSSIEMLREKYTGRQEYRLLNKLARFSGFKYNVQWSIVSRFSDTVAVMWLVEDKHPFTRLIPERKMPSVHEDWSAELGSNT